MQGSYSASANHTLPPPGEDEDLVAHAATQVQLNQQNTAHRDQARQVAKQVTIQRVTKHTLKLLQRQEDFNKQASIALSLIYLSIDPPSSR
jgi:hypothetical protein